MAHKATSWAWEVEGLSIPQKFLLVALADMADERFSCFPGQGLLAKMTGAKGKRSVLNNLAVLEERGYITRERRHREDGSRTSDRFVLQVGHQHPLGAPDAPPLVVDLGASGDTAKVHLTTTQGAPRALEENPQRNHQKESPDTPVVPAADSVANALELVWASWPTARRSTRKVVTAKWAAAVKAVGMKDLDRLTHAAVAFGERYGTWAPSEQTFVPLLSTWLHQERWTTPLPEAGRGNRSTVAHGRSVDEILAAREGSGRLAVNA